MDAIYKTTDGSKDETMTGREALALIDRLGDRVAPSYTSDDGEYEIYEVYGEGETAADYPDGDPYADSIWVPQSTPAAAALGRRGGASKSRAKRASSAANGKRGGRPRKST